MEKNSSSKPVDKINTVVKGINEGVLWAIMILGIVMLVISLAHIFYRYVLNNALTWSEELLRMMLVWFSLLSTTVISYQSEHIGIVIFREMMPEKVQKVLMVAVRFLILIATAVTTVIGVDFVIRSLGQVTPSLGMPYSVGYSAVPICFLIMTIYEINHIRNRDFMEEVEVLE